MCNLWPFKLIPTPGICILDAHKGVSHLVPLDQLVTNVRGSEDKYKLVCVTSPDYGTLRTDDVEDTTLRTRR